MAAPDFEQPADEHLQLKARLMFRVILELLDLTTQATERGPLGCLLFSIAACALMAASWWLINWWFGPV